MPQNKQVPSNMPRSEGEILTEQYNQVSGSIKSVFDLTSRIDERVKMLVERQNIADERYDKVLELLQQLVNRVTILESKDISNVKTDLNDMNKKIAIMENSETKHDKESSVTKHDMEDIKQKIHTLDLRVEAINMMTATQESRWAKLFDLVFKLTIMLIGGYLLFRFGWQAPP
jgi:hypothetical protein